MKNKKPQTIEEWLEANYHEMRSINQKLDKLMRKQSLSLEDLGLIDGLKLCEVLMITPKTLANWRKQKKLAFTKTGSRYFYLLSDVKSMLYEGFNRQ